MVTRLAIVPEGPAAWIQLVFVTLLTLIAWLRPLIRWRQWKVTILASVAVVLMAGIQYSARHVNPWFASVLHDWLPAVLLLIPYWQVGQFFTHANPEAERHLADFDRAFFRKIGIKPSQMAISPAAGAYLELAYVFVYPLIPLGLITLYVTDLEKLVDYYWIVVLPSTYACFAITPFVQAMPPRSLANYEKFKMPVSRVKKVNNFLLRRASIQAITFPSGHVASALAAALVLLRLEPWAGLIFLVIALSIAVATVVGGYHYAADVLLAMMLALMVFAATFWVLKPASASERLPAASLRLKL